MAELAALGAVVACFQLSDVFFELAKWIGKAMRGLQHIPLHILELRSDSQIYTICLRKLAVAVEEAYEHDPNSLAAIETATAMDLIQSQGWNLKREITKLVRKARGGYRNSSLSQVLAKLQLLFKPKSVQILQDTLTRLMHKTGVLSSGVILDSYRAELRKLKEAQRPIPQYLQRKISILEDEIVTHECLATRLEIRLANQIEEMGASNSLTEELRTLVSASEQLDRAVRATVSRVAPELFDDRERHRRRARYPRSDLNPSRHGSHVSSNLTSQLRTTPPTSPSTIEVPAVTPADRVRESSRSSRTDNIVPAQVPAVRQLSQSSREVVNLAPLQPVEASDESSDEDSGGDDAVEEPAVAPRGARVFTFGPVVTVSEEFQADEVYREWRSVPEEFQDDEIEALDEVEVIEEFSDVDGEGTSFSNNLDAQEEASKRAAVQISEEQAAAQAGKASIQPPLRRRTGAKRSVNIFSSSDTGIGEASSINQAEDARYRPVPPFDSNDARGRRK